MKIIWTDFASDSLFDVIDTRQDPAKLLKSTKKSGG